MLGNPDLRDVVDRYGPPPLWARRPGFATLVRIILEQQVSLASADSTFKRLDGEIDRVSPESVAALSLADLRGFGFTRQKAGYCLDLARLIVAGGLNLRNVSRAPDDEARAALLAVRGIEERGQCHDMGGRSSCRKRMNRS